MFNIKLKTIYAEYQNTTVVSGSKILYFFSFWLTKIVSFTQQRSNVLSHFIHKLVYYLPKPTFVIQNMSGIFFVQALDDSTTICSDYFEKDLRGWLTTPEHKDIFLDIGANRGIYSIIAPTLFEYREIHAFEPNPEVSKILTKNVVLNNLQNKVQVHELALGAQAGTADFACDPMHKGGGRIVSSASTKKNKVPVIALDELEPGIDSKRVSFVKLDTEGYEFSVLAGMKDTLTKMTPGAVLMIECTEVEKLTSWLAAYNFKHRETKLNDHLFSKHA